MSECASNLFEPGWLGRTLHEAHISCMVDHSPWFFDRLENYPRTKRPVPESEAHEIFERMNARFKAWTGKSLAEHVAAQIGEKREAE